MSTRTKLGMLERLRALGSAFVVMLLVLLPINYALLGRGRLPLASVLVAAFLSALIIAKSYAALRPVKQRTGDAPRQRDSDA